MIGKVMVMMVGEVEYNDIFYGDQSASSVLLPNLTQFIILCFVVTMIIVLQNLLIGLTLNDIDASLTSRLA